MTRHAAPLMTFLLAAGLLAGATALHVVVGRGVTGSPAAVRPPEAATFRFAFPEDRVLVYDFEHTARQAHGLDGLGAAAPGADAAAGSASTLQGVAHLAGQLVLQGLGREGEGEDECHRVSLRLTELSAVTATLQGRPLLGDAESAAALLTGHEAHLLLGPDGALVELRFTRDTPSEYRHMMRHMVGALGVSIPPGALAAQFDREEHTELGHFVSTYRRADGPLTYDRERRIERLRHAPGAAAAPSLQHTARIALDPAGYLVALDVDETLAVHLSTGAPLLTASTRARLALRAVREAPRRTPEADLVAETLDAPRFSDDAARRAAEGQAGGLTAEALLAALDAFGARGAGPDHRAFLWRAVARLQLDPALCAALAGRFEAETTGTAERALIADLLAAAGTEAAQAALRTALTSGAATADPEAAPALWQRLSLVRHPEAATLALAARGLTDAAGDSLRHHTAAYTLGAVAGARLRDAGGPGTDAAAVAAVETLRGALDAAATPEDRKHAARALQNARQPVDLDRFVALAADDDAGVRLAAVDALAHRPEPAATAALVARLDDAAGPVQARALDALQARGPHAATVDALLALARRGGLRAEALPAATAFVERAGLDAETAVLLADAILTNHTVPAALRGRLRRSVEG